VLEVGKVLAVDGKNATVQIKRSAACGKCGMCQVSEDRKTVLAKPKNTPGAKVGDTVQIEMAFSSLMKASLVVYLIPLVFFLAGCVIGFYLLDIASFGPNNPVVAFLFGIILLALSYGGIKLMENRGIFSEKHTMEIVKILTNKEL
jgi:sigma-E factor negative regulatory protein RseC